MTSSPSSPWSSVFEAAALPGLPPTGDRAIEFRATSRGVGREGLVARVRTAEGSWIGNFQPGDGTLNAILVTPAPTRLCVISRGRGYWVNATSPSEYEIIPAYPIRQVEASVEAGLLVLADDTSMVAYDEGGRRWASDRVSWDGVEILSVSSAGVEGRGWDATREQSVGFFVNALNGNLEGGAAPPG